MSINVGEVAMIPLSSIKVGDRARQEMGNLTEMENSMKERGLISPLAVKKVSDGQYELLAGERRFRILEKNKVEIVPARIYEHDLSEIECKSIELAENFYRKDFEYWEHDALTREIHSLQQQIHGVKSPGPSNSGWSIENTGEILGASKGTVSTSIKRAEAREAFPELFEKCKTKKDATKILKKMDEVLVKETIAKKLESRKSNSSFTKLAKCYVINDFFEGSKQIPDGIMHMVEIDPPYGINLQDAKKSDGESCYVKEDYNEISADKYKQFLANTFSTCYRIMSNHSWLLCWYAPEPWFNTIYEELVNAGFSTTRMCGIWNKSYGQCKRPEIHLANSYEMFFYAWKGRPALNKPGRSNVFTYSPVPPNQKTHPTERPVELMKEIYETFAFPGSRLLIPFLGSGNGIIAADQAGLSPIGFDLTKSYRDSFLIKLNDWKKIV